jgi:DNA-binding MarR family transcriptional regulator
MSVEIVVSSSDGTVTVPVDAARTVGYAILAWLKQINGRNEDSFVAPWGSTQNAIAQALAITRAHVAIELKRLLEERLIERSKRLVKEVPVAAGVQRLRKTYRLTPHGWDAVRDAPRFAFHPVSVDVQNPKQTRAFLVQRVENLEATAEQLKRRLADLEGRR